MSLKDIETAARTEEQKVMTELPQAEGWLKRNWKVAAAIVAVTILLLIVLLK